MTIMQRTGEVADGTPGSERQRLIMVSNRGPVEYRVDEAGQLVQHLNAGGVATALSSITASLPITWIANGMSLADCDLARTGEAIDLADNKRLRLVASPASTYDLYYGVFCNRLLWFLQHNLTDRLAHLTSEDQVIDAWEHGYLPVNQTFAEAIVSEIDREDGVVRVMLHDYHLYAAPLFVRNSRPHAVLQQFIHIPWPEPEAWAYLPKPIVQSICEGLLANDSAVFQTQSSAENFLRTCETYLPDARVDPARETISNGARRTRVWANPISVDVWELGSRLRSPEAAAYRDRLGPPGGQRTIVRVDRLDPIKNIVGGFKAYSRLFESHPELLGRVRFLAFLVPSRANVAEYEQYTAEVLAEVDAVNGRYGTSIWQPIEVFHEHNRTQALAALSLYDVLLVNSVADGMNLVSKEGPALNDEDGVLVLSKTAGSYAELRDGALAIEPNDIEGTAEALYRALTLPPDERAGRARLLRTAVMRHGLRHWLRRLLDDLEANVSSARDVRPDGASAASGTRVI